MTTTDTDTQTHTERTGRSSGRDSDPSPTQFGGGGGPKVLVAGIGNIFLGDDGFGVEVIGRLAGRPMPAGVKVADFGIRGLHLAYELLDGYDVLVLIDAMPIGDAAGTVALVEAEVPAAPVTDPDDPEAVDPALDAHSMSPAVVLASLAKLGGSVDRVLVVACQPATVADAMGLSDAVAAAVDPAVDAVVGLIADLVPVPSPPTQPTNGDHP